MAPDSLPVKVHSGPLHEGSVISKLRPYRARPGTILVEGIPALVTIASVYSVSVLLTWLRRQFPLGQPGLDKSVSTGAIQSFVGSEKVVSTHT